MENILILPYLKDQSTGLHDLPRLPLDYPDNRKKEFKKIDSPLNPNKFNEMVKTVGDRFFVVEGKKGALLIGISPDFQYDETGVVVMDSIITTIKVMVSMCMGHLSETGVSFKKNLKKITLPTPIILQFCCEFMSSKKEYEGNGGQIRLAGELNGLNMGQLYSLASGLLSQEEITALGWTMMNVPYETVGLFREKMKTSKEYEGNGGQIKLAGELGKLHLGHLYSLARGVLSQGEITDLGWTQISVPYEIVGLFKEKMKTPKEYEGNGGQIRLAGELGKLNLGQLYSLASGVLYQEEITDLGWTYMNVPYEIVGLFKEKMKTSMEYEGNGGQIRLTGELGKLHIGHLYGLASGVLSQEEITDLGWTQMNVPYEIVGLFKEKMKTPKQYEGNGGQIRLAGELGKLNMGHIYSLASGLLSQEEITALGWTQMSLPYETVGLFREKMKTPMEYEGNGGQIRLAAELGKINLSQLYSLASGLLSQEEITALGWTCMRVAYETIGLFSEKMKTPKEYEGNGGQIRLAGELGELNLSQLYSLASGLLSQEEITAFAWTKMDVPYEKAIKFQL